MRYRETYVSAYNDINQKDYLKCIQSTMSIGLLKYEYERRDIITIIRRQNPLQIIFIKRSKENGFFL